MHVLIVSARFYDDLADMLVKGASDALRAADHTFEILDVPGALEIPSVISFAIESGRFDGYVALGCVIRGETSHYDVVAGESARALMDIAVQRHAAIGNGILTCENKEQATVRASTEHKNKGGGAAEACIRMMELRRELGVSGR